MSNFIFAVNKVVPIFILIALGFLIRAKNWLDPQFPKILNRLCFQWMLPCMMFRTGYTANIRETFSLPLVAAALGSYFVILVLLLLIIPRVVPSRQDAGAVIQGAFRPNIAMFGIPLAVSLFGDAGGAAMAVIVALLVPILNTISVLLIAHFSAGRDQKPSPMKLVRDIATNRLIIGTVAGVLFSFFGLSLPALAYTPISDLAGAAVPIAMLSLGGDFNFGTALGHLRYSALASALRLAVIPAAVMAGMAALGFRGVELGALFIANAAPAAATGYVIASNMNCSGELSGEIVVMTTLFSAFTVVAGITILLNLGLI